MIKNVELFLNSGRRITIFLGDTVTVQEGEDGKVYVIDGRHNNGGWQVAHSYDEAVRKIREA